jgi:hypothetical protein
LSQTRIIRLCRVMWQECSNWLSWAFCIPHSQKT